MSYRGKVEQEVEEESYQHIKMKEYIAEPSINICHKCWCEDNTCLPVHPVQIGSYSYKYLCRKCRREFGGIPV